MSVENNKFVFVVCGAQQHINTLHFSLEALKQFTSFEILVVTDQSRNEVPVKHSQLFNVSTPAHLNNHQAAIYLKTGLHNFLPKGFNYCYLDTDVVALSKEVDDVFNQSKGAVTFAADHCSLRQFSPHAVNCGCAEKNQHDRHQIEALLKAFGYNPKAIASSLLHKQGQLKQQLQIVKHSYLQLLISAIRYLLSPNVFKLSKDYFYHRSKNYWADADGNIILYEVPTPGYTT